MVYIKPKQQLQAALRGRIIKDENTDMNFALWRNEKDQQSKEDVNTSDIKEDTSGY